MNTVTPTFTVEDLKRVLREVAGQAETVDLDADILDTTFGDLGYDSLALFEAGSHVQREHDVEFDVEAMTEAASPRDFLVMVNTALAGGERR
jgi:act minimal PKS acyl carrier protein